MMNRSETYSEVGLRRVRRFFELNPRKFSAAMKRVGVAYMTGRGALEPGSNPTINTVARMEQAVSRDFVLDEPVSHEGEDQSIDGPSQSETEGAFP